MTGAQGTIGMTGPQGLQGLTGEKGDTGVAGAIGPQGLQGIQGMTGAQGTTGMTGPQGIQGAKGDTGLAGAIGPQGLQGIQGMTGAQGTTGIQGLKGDTGVTGPEGPEGVQAISISNDTLYLSNGGSVYLGDYAKDSVIDSDNDSTNEIQVLNYSNDTLYLSSSNFVVVPSSSGNTGVPVGTIMLYAGNSIPTGWILCDGSAISRSTYSTLFTALGTSWGQGDNSTTFNLPDMRGRFARGVDAGADNDPDASGRTALHTGGNTGDNVGSYQSDEIKSHGHLITSGGGFGNTSLRRNGDGGNTSGTQNEGGLETRPVNAGVYYIIKF
jgi:microcystin-dependent protein